MNGHIAVNKTRFPDGIDGLANKIHDMKLKLGIYSSTQLPCLPVVSLYSSRPSD